jgi:hypothetical protein
MKDDLNPIERARNCSAVRHGSMHQFGLGIEILGRPARPAVDLWLEAVEHAYVMTLGD